MPDGRSPGFSNASLALARELVAGALAGAADDAAQIAGLERICQSISAGLSGWFGPYGSLALLARSLDGVRANHPALASIIVTAPALSQPPTFSTFAASVHTHGGQAASDGLVALIAALADLIGRLVGDDLAVTLLRQSVSPSMPGSTNGTDAAGNAVQSSVKDP